MDYIPRNRKPTQNPPEPHSLLGRSHTPARFESGFSRGLVAANVVRKKLIIVVCALASIECKEMLQSTVVACPSLGVRFSNVDVSFR